MIRFLTLFCVFFGLHLGLVLAQVDPYDAYLNQKKQPDGSTKPSRKLDGADFRDRFLQDVGANFYTFEDQTSRLFLPGIHYIGRYVWKEHSEKLSTTVGTHPSLGLQFGNFASYFMFNVPVLLEVNLGKGSSRYNESGIGLSLGAGPEYSLTRSWGSFALPLRINQVTGVAAATLRFRLQHRDYYLRYSESFFTPVGALHIRSFAFGNSLF